MVVTYTKKCKNVLNRIILLKLLKPGFNNSKSSISRTFFNSAFDFNFHQSSTVMQCSRAQTEMQKTWKCTEAENRVIHKWYSYILCIKFGKIFWTSNCCCCCWRYGPNKITPRILRVLQNITKTDNDQSASPAKWLPRPFENTYI